MTHNFRPGVMEKIGLDFAAVAQLNPRLVYGVVTGYGPAGPWKDKPGQDLLVQSLSGLTWLSGGSEDGPVPMGLAVVDILCGSHFVQGILAALLLRANGPRRPRRGEFAGVDSRFPVRSAHDAPGRRRPRPAALPAARRPRLSGGSLWRLSHPRRLLWRWAWATCCASPG